MEKEQLRQQINDPYPAKPIVENIPLELAGQDCWVNWKAVFDPAHPEKPKKVPFQPNGKPASSTDPGTWVVAHEAIAAYETGKFTGIGIAFGGGGLIGIDIDKLDTTLPGHKWLETWIKDAKEAGAYIEKSPSGNGLHVLIRGRLQFPGGKAGPFEVYARGRYFTWTGVPALLKRGLGAIIGGEAAQRLVDSFVANAGIKAPLKKDLPARLSATPNIDPAIIDRVATEAAEREPALWRGDWGAGPLGGGYPSQSEADLALMRSIAKVAVNAGVPEAEAAAVLEGVFSRSALAQRAKWVERADYRERVISPVVDEWQRRIVGGGAGVPAVSPRDELRRRLEELSARYFVAKFGKDVRVFERNPRKIAGEETAIEDTGLPFDAFCRLLANNLIFIPQDDGRTKRVEVAREWLAWPERRTFAGIVFDPSGKTDSDIFNTYRGLQITPAPGDCSRLLRHIWEVWAREDQQQYDYILGYFADMVQRPYNLPRVGLMVRGKQGAGKSCVATALLRAFGPHGLSTSRAEQVFGRFTGHTANAILLVLEEAIFAADPATVNAAKDRIGNWSISVERKGIDGFKARNYARVVAFTNAEFSTPKTADDRHWFAIEVADKYVGNHEYFAELHAELDAGGDAAFLHHLLQLDVSEFNPAAMPETSEAKKQRAEQLFAKDPVGGWLLLALQNGGFQTDGGFFDWSETIDAAQLGASYAAFTTGMRHAPSWPLASKRMREYLPPGSVSTKRARVDGCLKYVATLPGLDVAREFFAKTRKVEL